MSRYICLKIVRLGNDIIRRCVYECEKDNGTGKCKSRGELEKIFRMTSNRRDVREELAISHGVKTYYCSVHYPDGGFFFLDTTYLDEDNLIYLFIY